MNLKETLKNIFIGKEKEVESIVAHILAWVFLLALTWTSGQFIGTLIELIN